MKLLKIYSLCAIMLGTVTMTNAQTSSGSKMDDMMPHFGIKGGVNFATINGNDFDSPDARTSFHVGALVQFPLTEMFSLQAEALYSGEGFKTNIPSGLFGGDSNDEVEYQLDYINVPILARVYVIQGLSIDVGPQFDFKVNEEFDGDPGNDDGDWEVSKAKDFGVSAAGGLTFETGIGLFATGRYTIGLTDVFEDQDAKNAVWQIGIGYKF